MVADTEPSVAERLRQLLQHLGIAQAHVAVRLTADWSGLAATHPELFASLTLVCPTAGRPGRFLPGVDSTSPPSKTLSASGRARRAEATIAPQTHNETACKGRFFAESDHELSTPDDNLIMRHRDTEDASHQGR